jgi:hypothetical protein
VLPIPKQDQVKQRHKNGILKITKKWEKSIRQGKRNYIKNLAEKAKQAARHPNMKELYDITRKLAGV